ncbi:MAG: hypothetical protein QG655_2810 [Actinomycetota bacterium]|jgi:hypothetical protein|nr:hypothetical protein [Actinomycetota bacterium]
MHADRGSETSPLAFFPLMGRMLGRFPRRLLYPLLYIPPGA